MALEAPCTPLMSYLTVLRIITVSVCHYCIKLPFCSTLSQWTEQYKAKTVALVPKLQLYMYVCACSTNIHSTYGFAYRLDCWFLIICTNSNALIWMWCVRITGTAIIIFTVYYLKTSINCLFMKDLYEIHQP